MLLVVLCNVFISFIRSPFGPSPTRTGTRHPRWHSQSKADQNQSQTGHICCHGDLREQGVVSGNMGVAVAGLKVPDDSENLLTFCLLDHPSDIQDSGDMLPPERIKMFFLVNTLSHFISINSSCSSAPSLLKKVHVKEAWCLCMSVQVKEAWPLLLSVALKKADLTTIFSNILHCFSSIRLEILWNHLLVDKSYKN